MYLKAIGAILLIAGGAYTGCAFAAALRRRVQLLSDLIAALSLMKAEIVLKLSPMPEVLSLLGAQRGLIGTVFDTMARNLLIIDMPGLSYIWTKTLDEHKNELMLPQDAYRALCSLGDMLGRYASEEQEKQIEYVVSRLEEGRQRAQEEYERQGKLYRRMGVAGGAALAILLL